MFANKNYKSRRPIFCPFCILMLFILNISIPVLEAYTDPDFDLFFEMEMSSTPNPVGSGARALGMGGAFISIADDATAASWNPAALIVLKRAEMSCVISHNFSRRTHDTAVSGEIDDLSNEQSHLNYLSLAVPFTLFSRLMVFSLNYQHLYEFSYEKQSQWITYDEVALNLENDIHEKQWGSLTPLSPALAIQVIPALSFGATVNIWSDKLFTSYWENMSTVNRRGIVLGYPKRIFSQLYEKYEFSGINFHLGFLLNISNNFKFGGVVKTPFRARIDHTLKYIALSENFADISDREYTSYYGKRHFKFNMPVSYGIGASLGFLDNNLLFSMDIYRTRWDNYFMITPTGRRSPINFKLKNEANIKPTIQIRLGAEYLLFKKGLYFPLRAGVLYDPEPSEVRVDDFFGISIGTGIVSKDYSFDIAYQYRFGEKRGTESMSGRKTTTEVKQHYLYSSIIAYF